MDRDSLTHINKRKIRSAEPQVKKGANSLCAIDKISNFFYAPKNFKFTCMPLIQFFVYLCATAVSFSHDWS